MIQKIYIIIPISVISIFLLVNFADAQSTESKVPAWIQNTAKWYGDGIVSEGEFLNAIKFLLENKIIILSQTDEKTTDPTEPIPTSSPITKPRLNYCIILQPTYKSLGKLPFENKYAHVTYIKDCVKLYNDPIWNYKGADRIDKLYEKFLEFREQSKLDKQKLSTEPHVTILSSVNVGTQKYLVKFNVCAGDLIVDKAKILIKSEIESVEIGSTKDIPANSCRTYETQVHAKHTANIKVSIVEQVLIAGSN
jgi:hypothetical protein